MGKGKENVKISTIAHPTDSKKEAQRQQTEQVQESQMQGLKVEENEEEQREKDDIAGRLNDVFGIIYLGEPLLQTHPSLHFLPRSNTHAVTNHWVSTAHSYSIISISDQVELVQGLKERPHMSIGTINGSWHLLFSSLTPIKKHQKNQTSTTKQNTFPPSQHFFERMNEQYIPWSFAHCFFFTFFFLVSLWSVGFVFWEFFAFCEWKMVARCNGFEIIIS